MSELDAQKRQAVLKRDARLRRRILQALDQARSPHGGWLRAITLWDVVGDELEDQRHLLRLCDDLKRSGYLTERDDRHYTWQAVTADTVSYQITDQGVRLLNEAIDPDPEIADERIQ